MIELIFNEEDDTTNDRACTVQLPHNVRQIGEPGEKRKIYIEDYVHTYLNQFCEGNLKLYKIAVLLGSKERSGGVQYFFVKSAFEVPNIKEENGKYMFSEEIWGYIYGLNKEQFPGQEILGWFLSRPGFPLEITPTIADTHLTFFCGSDKILYLFEPMEKEEGIYAFSHTLLQREPGFYIFYDQNAFMQNYMINSKNADSKTSEKPEKAITSFRTIIRKKQEERKQRQKWALIYLMCAGAMIGILLTAVGLFGKNRALDNEIRQTASTQVEAADKGQVLIEEVDGNVKKQEEDGEPDTALPVEQTIEGSEEEPETDAASEPAQESTSTQVVEEYVVKPGDTLVSICKNKYGTADMVEQVCQFNGIRDWDYIYTGQVILLP